MKSGQIILALLLVFSLSFVISCAKGQPEQEDETPPIENLEETTETQPPADIDLGGVDLPVIGASSDLLRETLGIASSEKTSTDVDNIIEVEYGKYVKYKIWNETDRVIEVSLTPDADGKLPENSPILYDISLGMDFEKALAIMILNGFVQAKGIDKFEKYGMQLAEARFIHSKYNFILWVTSDVDYKTLIAMRSRDGSVAEIQKDDEQTSQPAKTE